MGAMRRWLPLVIIVVAAVAAFHNSFSGVFLLDDERGIVDNDGLRDPAHFWQHLLKDRRPTVWMSLALNYAAGGLDVWGYHLVNLVIHTLAGLTLYGIVHRLLATGRFSERVVPAARDWALAVALIWVVHPLQTQSVTYIIQRGESLMGLLYLLTVYCVVRGAGASRPHVWYFAAVIACALGMGSKAVMVTAPLIVLITDRVFIARSFGEVLRRRWALYAGLCATWLVLVTTGVVRGVFAPDPEFPTMVGFGHKGTSPMQYLMTQAEVIPHYLRLSVWPDPLCLDYTWLPAQSLRTVAIPGLVMIGLLGVTVWALWKRPPWGYVGAWFFIILAPTSSIVPIHDVAFEHRMYLSLAAVIVAGLAVGHGLLGRIHARFAIRPAMARRANAVLVLVVVTLCGYRTIDRNKDYHSTEAMWREVISVRPDNPRAHLGLGWALIERRDFAGGVRHSSEAIRLRPTYAAAHCNLAIALAGQGRTDEAIEHYREALRLRPKDAETHYNLGCALGDQGKTDEAVEHYRRAIHFRPRHAQAHNNLGVALIGRGKPEEAIRHCREALRFEPDLLPAHINLALALLEQGRVDEAMKPANRAREMAPDHPAVRHIWDRVQSARQQNR